MLFRIRVALGLELESEASEEQRLSHSAGVTARTGLRVRLGLIFISDPYKESPPLPCSPNPPNPQ